MSICNSLIGHMPTEQQESYLSAKRKRAAESLTDDAKDQFQQWCLATGFAEEFRRAQILVLGQHAASTSSEKNKSACVNMKKFFNLNAIAGRAFGTDVIYEMRDYLSEKGLKVPVQKKSKKTTN